MVSATWVKKNMRLVGVVVVILILVVVLTWKIAAHHISSSQKDLDIVQAQVGKLMLLPKDEQPTLATVTDKTQLKDQFLSAHAENGDKILIYTRSQTVIIYRPKINKIVTVGNVTVDPSLAEAKNATLTVVDGSNNPQKTQAIINKVKAAYPDIKVTDGGKISRQDLPNTIVIDNTSQKDDLLFALVDVVSGKRGIVPLGVDKVSTDLMIIVGADQ